ncbi:MAG: hypothetical protein KBS59_05790, partial [Clostridiales bacterium]|nr:hypothetical protein [Clostridiales bacterium]
PALMCIFSAFLGVLVNLRWPKFDWLDETVAVKQSGAVGITLGIMFLFPIVFLVLYVIVSPFVSVCAAMWIFAAILAIFDILMYNKIVKRGGARFAALNAR